MEKANDINNLDMFQLETLAYDLKDLIKQKSAELQEVANKIYDNWQKMGLTYYAIDFENDSHDDNYSMCIISAKENPTRAEIIDFITEDMKFLGYTEKNITEIYKITLDEALKYYNVSWRKPILT